MHTLIQNAHAGQYFAGIVNEFTRASETHTCMYTYTYIHTTHFQVDISRELSMNLQARQQLPAQLKAEIFERKEKLTAYENDPDPPGGHEAVCMYVCLYVCMCRLSRRPRSAMCMHA
jgi:hypothetical protein